MQLSFDLGAASALPRVRDGLLTLFGPQRTRGRLDPLSQLIHAVLCARTADAAAWSAFARLRGAYPDWAALASAAPGKIEAAIAQVAYAERKARQLPTLVRVIQIRAGGLDLGFLAERPVEEAMEWLQSLPGVGVKAAAATLNFSTLARPVLVVDSHVHRIARRLGLASRTADAAQAHAALSAMIPSDWGAEPVFELHWLLKGHGQSVCAEAAPRCGMCPMKAWCPRVGLGVGRKVVDFPAGGRRAATMAGEDA